MYVSVVTVECCEVELPRMVLIEGMKQLPRKNSHFDSGEFKDTQHSE